MAKRNGLLNFVLWLVAVIAVVSVGSAMIAGVLSIPWLPSIVTVVAGWVIVIGIVLGAIMAIIQAAK